MAEETVAVDINATPDVLWACSATSRARGLLPGIESVVIEEDDRVLNLAGMEIRERLISRDDESSTLVYSSSTACPSSSTKPPSPSCPVGSTRRSHGRSSASRPRCFRSSPALTPPPRGLKKRLADSPPFSRALA